MEVGGGRGVARGVGAFGALLFDGPPPTFGEV